LHEIELVLALLVVVTALTPIARRLHVPYPILLVLAGLILALLPIVPDIPLDPNLALLLFLPPLLYSAAFSTSIRDFRVLLRPILSLAVGLVLVTTAVVAVLLHTLLPGVGWAAAFAFGAIVSPPDAVAAVAVFRGLGVPRQIVTLLEGESLVNDATALVTYRTAVGAMAVAVTAGETSVRFVVVGVGGVLVGLVVAVLVAALRRRIEDPSVEIALTLLTPFAAFLPAEQLGLSGVLAAVTAGLYMGWREPYITGSESRISGRAVWQMVDFVLNGLVFILIGLQLSLILPALAGQSLIPLIGIGLLVSLALILVRMAWVFSDTYLRWWVDQRKARRLQEPLTAPPPRPQETFVVGWAGMRGVVSLAAALTLPATTPERAELIFLTFLVILVTLVGQGLTLPGLIRALRVAEDGSGPAQQELRARRTVTEAALARIDQLAGQWPTHLPLINALRAQYDHRASHLGDPPAGADGETPADQELLEHHLIRRAVIDAERHAVLNLRERGEIDDAAWRDIERELDLEELRMDA
jgi:CPA1 family monovalent cation:H+ antiporter